MRSLIVAVSLVALFPAGSVAQEWSAAQQEVWTAVSNLCDRFYANDVDGLYEYVHPELVWWNIDNDAPGDYDTALLLDGASMPTNTWIAGSCSPLTGWLTDTVFALTYEQPSP